MQIQVEVAVIGLIQALMVAVIGGMFARDSTKRKKDGARAEARAAMRAEESHLTMKLMSAGVNLGIATAIAVKDQKVNGQMHATLEEAETVEQEYRDFIRTMASQKITE